MKTKRFAHLTLALFTLLPLACASYDTKHKRIDVNPTEGTPGVLGTIDDVKEKRAEREKTEAERNSVIHVVCTVYRVNRAFEGATACETIDFALEDEEGVEIARKNPDATGAIDFPAPAGKTFKVVPRVPSAWTIEWIPTGELKAGDSVKIILRR